MKIYKSQMPEITLKYRTTDQQKVKIKTSKDAFHILLDLYNKDTIEYLETAIVLFLNRMNNTIGWMKISEGGTACTVIDQKILFATALKCGASAFVLSHNHPSGELRPSETDVKMTRRLATVGKLLEITLLDHIIVTENGYYSMSENLDIH